jgi:hypothetical protein
MPSIPPAPVPAPAPGAFLWISLGRLPGGGAGPAPWWVVLYEQAFAEAQAVVRPSLPERDLLAVWN